VDKTQLRLILAAIGAVVIAWVYIWGRYKPSIMGWFSRPKASKAAPKAPKPRAQPKEAAFKDETRYDDALLRPAPQFPGEHIIVEEVDDEDYGFGAKAEKPKPEAPKPNQAASAERPPKQARSESIGAPFLIQISVVAGEEGHFNGAALREALLELDLIYGDMGIYHRYDRDYRQPLFSVASLVEPGTFPLNMEDFECPGVVMFFQPPQVEQPLAVFEDLVNACHQLAYRLGGMEWDEKRQILSDEKVALMRSRLRDAY
jgi:cell division protein ZipA